MNARSTRARLRRFPLMSYSLLLVAAVAAFLIYRIGRVLLSNFRHVTDEELEEYWSGNMTRYDRAGYRRVSEHLATCQDCRDRFEKLTERPGSGPITGAGMIQRRY